MVVINAAASGSAGSAGVPSRVRSWRVRPLSESVEVGWTAASRDDDVSGYVLRYGSTEYDRKEVTLDPNQQFFRINDLR